MIPATVGLWIVSLPVCRLAFEHGHFDETATRLVSEATCLYVLGLFAHAGIKITAQAFYPIRKPKWPFWAAVVNMVSTALLNLSALLFVSDPHLKFLALPLATTVGVFFTFFFLWLGLDRYGIQFDYSSMLKEGGRVLLACLIMALTTKLALMGTVALDLPLGRVWEVFLPIAVGAVTYFFAAKIIGCKSFEWINAQRKKRKKS